MIPTTHTLVLVNTADQKAELDYLTDTHTDVAKTNDKVLRHYDVIDNRQVHADSAALEAQRIEWLKLVATRLHPGGEWKGHRP